MKTNPFFVFFAAVCLMAAIPALSAEPERPVRKVQEEPTPAAPPEQEVESEDFTQSRKEGKGAEVSEEKKREGPPLADDRHAEMRGEV